MLAVCTVIAELHCCCPLLTALISAICHVTPVTLSHLLFFGRPFFIDSPAKWVRFVFLCSCLCPSLFFCLLVTQDVHQKSSIDQSVKKSKNQLRVLSAVWMWVAWMQTEWLDSVFASSKRTFGSTTRKKWQPFNDTQSLAPHLSLFSTDLRTSIESLLSTFYAFDASECSFFLSHCLVFSCEFPLEPELVSVPPCWQSADEKHCLIAALWILFRFEVSLSFSCSVL